MKICDACKKQEAIHEEHKERALCEDCMKILELSWDRDNYEFVDDYRTCMDCGGIETWCNCCQMYDCHDCDPYGTCMCS